MEESSKGLIPSAIFRCPLPFDLPDSQTKGACWEKWIRRFKCYLHVTCKNHIDEQARDLVVYVFGGDLEDLLMMFLSESIITYKGLIKCLTDSFDPQQNVDFERYMFNTACERASKSINNFVTRLCKHICEFVKFDNEAAKGCVSSKDVTPLGFVRKY
ncbi:hypothetical protein NDU88_007042 [Pleurodeles waltl]|uniref:Uncharacterized protein n=1 Tax=Pleurodeles waltl TaxID=8319 RepID=A0AAV7PK57_PLEWA|nr:hypothetical protein NDU88_007042 [Pleurodeles waltl]